MASNIRETFLHLVRIGIGHAESTDNIVIELSGTEWMKLKALAEVQGLSAIVLDGVDKLNANLSNSANTLQLEFKLEWIGEVLQDYEQRYSLYQKAIGNLAGFYKQHGFKMMVLKGYACSLDWPKPEHRPCGDIDIWLFGQQKEADETLQSLSRIGELENKIEIDNSHHHHSVFEWEGFTVENHYDFINVHHQKSSASLEKKFKELGQDDSHFIDVCGERVYLPSPNLHALFLLKHMISHFAAAEITLRQVLDWGFFMKAHSKEVDWVWMNEKVEMFGMKDFMNCINAICIENLGFDAKDFPAVQAMPELKDRVLNDIQEPEFTGVEPKRLISRVVFKWHRWKANEWKHKLCYKESMWSSFWSGVWNHLLKPKSI